jgi:predicted phage baseplate assembly protein
VDPTVVVVVNEGGFDITWTKVDNFLASSSTDRHFTTTVNANDQVIITFGDGNLGKIPPLGSAITASYRIGGGTRGNVGAGQINSLISSSPTNVLSVVNPLAASGGIDRESNEEAKILGPLFARANDRAITKQDYETLAASFSSANGSINKALAVATNYNNVNIYAAVQGPNGTGVPASAALKADLKNYLDSKGMIWVTTTILDPIYSPVDITLNLKVLGNYVGTQVQSAVNASLQNFLAFENQDFDGTLRLSDAYNVINQNQGIDYFNITKFQRSSDPPMAPADIVGLPSEIFEPGTITINLI